MSTQIRTRMISPIDSGGTTIMGACCFSDSEEPVSASYYDCLNGGGYFQIIPNDETIEDIDCPDLGAVGCCCSCNYVGNFDDFLEDPFNYEGGIQDATFCECNTLGGIWSPPIDGIEQGCDDILDTFIFCTDGTNNIDDDVRIPKACCHDGNCDNVCSPEQCLNLVEDDQEATLISFAVCGDYEIGSYSIADCGEPALRRMGERDRITNIVVVDKKPTKKDRIEIYSGKINQEQNKSFCVYEHNNEIKCKQLSKPQCSIKNGIWGGFDSSGNSLDCDSDAALYVKNIITNNGKIDSLYVNSWELGQEIFDGGRFAGIFNSNSSNFGSGSICVGNRKTGIAVDYVSESTINVDSGFEKTKYAVIVSKEDTQSIFDFNSSNITNQNIKDGSFCDTLRNKRIFSSTRIQKIISIDDSNFIRWSVPSLDVLSFVQRNVITPEFIKNSKINTNERSKFAPMKEKYYWSSTPYGKINNNVYFYTQLFRKKIKTNKNSFVKISPIDIELCARPVWMLPIN